MKRTRIGITTLVAAAMLAIVGFAPNANTAHAASFDPNQPHSLAQIAEHGRQSPARAGATGWYSTFITAYSGGGCMGYASDTRLAPIESSLCTGDADDTVFYVRDLNGSTWAVGDELEFVDIAKLYAIGYSGGQFKLETPSLPTTELIFYTDNSFNQWDSWILGYNTGGAHVFPAPNGRDLPLKVKTSESYPADGWFPCVDPEPQCFGGNPPAPAF
jgi:hypothetical protein